MAAPNNVLSFPYAAPGKMLAEARAWYRAPDGTVSTECSTRKLKEIVRSGEGTLWVDVDVRDRKQHALLENVFEFHALAREDVLNPASRVKVEEFANYLFVIVRGVLFNEQTPDDPYDIDTYNVYFFLGRNFVVTAHAEWSPSIEIVQERISRSPDLLERGPARTMHAVMDATVDGFFPIIDQLDHFVDGLEERIFGRFDRESIQDIFSVKRLILSLRRHLVPQREVFSVLANRPNTLLPPETQLYYRDIYDHVIRITDSLDSFRELLTSTQDAYLNQVSNRLGSVTKALSVFGVMSVPFVVVSGMWGMNFTKIPLATHPQGFWIMLVLQLALGLLLLALLRMRGLL